MMMMTRHGSDNHEMRQIRMAWPACRIQKDADAMRHLRSGFKETLISIYNVITFKNHQIPYLRFSIFELDALFSRSLTRNGPASKYKIAQLFLGFGIVMSWSWYRVFWSLQNFETRNGLELSYWSWNRSRASSIAYLMKYQTKLKPQTSLLFL